jgi:hypothetical protein
MLVGTLVINTILLAILIWRNRNEIINDTPTEKEKEEESKLLLIKKQKDGE